MPKIANLDDREGANIGRKIHMRQIEIFHAEPNTPEGEELELLLVLVKDYDDKHFELPELDPIEVIKSKMLEMGMKNKDLEPIIGSKGHVSAVLSGKREITLKMAKNLKNSSRFRRECFFILHRSVGFLKAPLTAR